MQAATASVDEVRIFVTQLDKVGHMEGTMLIKSGQCNPTMDNAYKFRSQKIFTRMSKE